MRPGPHIDLDGRRRPPLGTLAETMQRAYWGDPPEPLSPEMRARVLATLIDDAEFRAAVRSILLEGAD